MHKRMWCILNCGCDSYCFWQTRMAFLTTPSKCEQMAFRGRWQACRTDRHEPLLESTQTHTHTQCNQVKGNMTENSDSELGKCRIGGSLEFWRNMQDWTPGHISFSQMGCDAHLLTGKSLLPYVTRAETSNLGGMDSMDRVEQGAQGAWVLESLELGALLMLLLGLLPGALGAFLGAPGALRRKALLQVLADWALEADQARASRSKPLAMEEMLQTASWWHLVGPRKDEETAGESAQPMHLSDLWDISRSQLLPIWFECNGNCNLRSTRRWIWRGNTVHKVELTVMINSE